MISMLLFFAFLGNQPPKTATASKFTVTKIQREPAQTLEFAEMYTATRLELKPSEKLLALDQKQVRITGFMAEMEEKIKGGFYLTPFPCHCDESGGGTGDIPPQAIRVILAYAPDRELPHASGRIQVQGRLEVGAFTHPDGHVSHVRLVLDKAPPAPKPPTKTLRSKSSSKK